MKKLSILVAALVLPVAAFGDYNLDYDMNHNYNTNRASSESNSSAMGVGISGASASARGGSARAYGGDATQGQFQGQHQGQSNYGLNRQSLRGVGSGNTTSVNVIENYEAPKKADVPAIAPPSAAGNPTATCIATWAGSGAYGGLVSIGGSGYVYSKPCLWGEVARAAAALGHGDVAAMALAHMYNQTVEITGIVGMEEEEVVADLTTDPYAYESQF